MTCYEEEYEKFRASLKKMSLTELRTILKRKEWSGAAREDVRREIYRRGKTVKRTTRKKAGYNFWGLE